MRLKDKVAVVTGGGGAVSIGRAICLRFASEGARVAVVDIDEAGAQAVAEDIRTAGGEALALRCDVTDETQTQQMAKSVIDAWGRIDVLVNNAAGDK
ncbi:MAG: SDR family NAD(P)-dependent oxidoreductase, partial [Actinobacteria bacterium]|nr:SDR family NAD(P)-dependent oxidoreductase [Actinomycetota bacterium]